MKHTLSKADLHVHSKYSDRPSEWFLRRIGAPESFMEPSDVYRTCKEAGMDFVTISDHNCIRGALEIAHHPDAFISSELTTYFPENGCKIHCLVTGITAEQFKILNELRENIYDLQPYLNEQSIIHSIAHPLFRVNDRLTIEQFEKLLLLFNRFEGINGSRDPRACRIANLVLNHLTPEHIQQLADRHDIAPTGPEPWKKVLTGGSDDHSGLHIAGAYTATPHAATVDEFLAHIRNGNHEACGRGGTSIRLANSLYKITYGYYRSHFTSGKKTDTSVVGAMLRKLSSDAPPAPKATGVRGTFQSSIKKIVMKKRRRQLSDIELLIVDELARVLEQNSDETSKQEIDSDNQQFYTACKISQQLGYTFLNKFADKLQSGNIIGSLQAISSLGPVALAIAPYLTAFATQHKDEAFLQSVTEAFPSAKPLRQKSGKRAWITDTLDDVNGVAHTIHTLANLSNQQGKPITVITCLPEKPVVDYPLKNFQPVGTFNLPEYESIQIPFPPFLEVLHYLEQGQFDEVIISTPGSLGVCGLLAARLLGLTIRGIYHTDFPQFVRSMTDDDTLSGMTWKFMSWFYRDMETVFVPTQHYRTLLMQHDFDPSKLSVLQRGVNLNDFSPAKRNPTFWPSHQLDGHFTFLYVGRISKEKNIEHMIEGFLEVKKTNPHARLALVGDGPTCQELRQRYPHPCIAFTGFLLGDDLQTAYASADAFVFPSMTDTFGNAVLEAHASGLPAIVSDRGGPQEIVRSHQSGIIIDATRADSFRKAMEQLLIDEHQYSILRKNALKKAAESTWDVALKQLG